MDDYDLAKSNAEVVRQNFLPEGLLISNYPKALTTMPFLQYTVNTLKITILNMIGTVFRPLWLPMRSQNYAGKGVIFGS